MSRRVMALDYGEARIGVAMSDTLGMIATPHSVIRTKNQGEQTRAVEALVTEHEVAAIVVGMPYELDGTEGPMAQQVGKFVAKVALVTGLEVHTWDERLTSVQAERVIKEGGGSRKRKKKGKGVSDSKGDVDMMAATILLQSYLDSPTGASGGL